MYAHVITINNSALIKFMAGESGEGNGARRAKMAFD